MSDLIGILNNPGPTVGKLMEKKQWLAGFLIIVIGVLIFSYLTFPILMEETKFAEKFTDEGIENPERLFPLLRIFASLTNVFFISLKLIIAAFFVYLFYKLFETEGMYIHYFTAVVNASLINLFLKGVIETILVLSKQSMMISTSLTILFPSLDHRSIEYLVLSQFDLFTIWCIVVMASGIAVFARIDFKRSLLISGIYFIFTVFVSIALSYVWIRIFKF